MVGPWQPCMWCIILVWGFIFFGVIEAVLNVVGRLLSLRLSILHIALTSDASSVFFVLCHSLFQFWNSVFVLLFLTHANTPLL